MADDRSRGFFLLPRGWQEHPAWRGEPFSRAQAWAWMVEEARWRPSRISVAGRTVELQRGELSHSIRFLAERWGWGKGVVERFISRLKTETLIETRTETGQLVISIRNYDQMQATPEDSETTIGTPSETPPGQQQDSTGTKKKKTNQGNEGKEGREYLSLAFASWWSVYPKKVSKGKAWSAYQRVAKTIEPEILLTGAQRYAVERKGQDPKFTKHPSTWLNGHCWLDEAPPMNTTGRGRRDAAAEQDAAAADLDAAIDRMAANG